MCQHASEGSLVQRYGMVLEEFRLEVVQNNPQLQQRELFDERENDSSLVPSLSSSSSGPYANFHSTSSLTAYSSLHNLAAAAAEAGIIHHSRANATEVQNEISPSEPLARMTGWDQFESLVRWLVSFRNND
jgi:hypothetical protein